MSYPESISSSPTSHLAAYAAMAAGEFEKTKLYLASLKEVDDRSHSSRITIAAETPLTTLEEMGIINDSPIKSNNVSTKQSVLRSEIILLKQEPKPLDSSAEKVNVVGGFLSGSLKADAIILTPGSLASRKEEDLSNVLSDSFLKSEWGSALAANSLQEKSFTNNDDEFDEELMAAMALSLEANPYVEPLSTSAGTSAGKFSSLISLKRF